MQKKALIFTKRVLPRSNTFVAAQGTKLPTYKPVFIGLRNNPSGIALINGHKTCVQENIESMPVVSRLLLDGMQCLTPKWEKALKDQSANIIHAHFGKGGYYSTPIAKALDIPMITTFHGSDITQNDKFSYGKKHREITFNNSSKVIAASKFIANKLIQRGCPEHKIIQHYVGLDTLFFTPTTEKNVTPTLLFVGRLIEQKGCHFLLKAMQTINKKMPEAQLIIAGYGAYKKQIMAQAKNLKNIKFVGAQSREQIKILMAQAWVTCLPSIVMERGNEEGLSMVCLESQASGTPIVAFDTGGVKETMIDGETGFLCQEKNTKQLADQLLTLLESNSLREQFSLAGKTRVNTLFNINQQCLELETIYNTLT